MKSLIERLQRAYQLPRGELAILGQAWGFFLLVELALRILPFPRLLALSERLFLRRRGAPATAAPPLPRLVRLVEVAGRYALVSATCLKRALVLSWLLARRGIATTVRLGVARRDGRFEAHAWLEREGRMIFDEPGTGGYEPLFPAGLRAPDTR